MPPEGKASGNPSQKKKKNEFFCSSEGGEAHFCAQNPAAATSRHEKDLFKRACDRRSFPETGLLMD